MPDEPLHPTALEVEISSAPKDLRAELQTDLQSDFISRLAAAGTLPKAVSDSLVALLSVNGSTSADVIAALGLEDPTQPEVANE